MKKIILILKEMKKLLVTHNLYFLAPLIIALALVALLFVKLGASIIMTFIYAGV